MSTPPKKVAEIPHISGVDKGNVISRICIALYSIPSGWNNLWSIPQSFVEQILLFASFEGIYRLGKDFTWFVSACSWCDANESNDGASIKPNGQTTTNGFSIVIDPRMHHVLHIMCIHPLSISWCWAWIWPPLNRWWFSIGTLLWGLKISDSNTMRFGNRTSRLGRSWGRCEGLKGL